MKSIIKSDRFITILIAIAILIFIVIAPTLILYFFKGVLICMNNPLTAGAIVGSFLIGFLFNETK